MDNQPSSPEFNTAQSEATDEFTLVEKEEAADYVQSPPIEQKSNSENPSKKTAKLVIDTDDEDEEEAEEIGAGVDTDLLADYPDNTEEMDLVHSRISSCSSLNLPRFGPYLKRLCLRQNLISALDPADFGPLTEIEDIDFYDNKIKHLGDALNNMHKLKVLDLSFNLLKAVPNSLGSHPVIDTIYFVQNKISHIEHFDSVGTTLRSLELGGNRIRAIEKLDALTNLQELWLGKNKLTKLQNLDHLKRLKILSLQSNRITIIENLEGLEALEELYLSHNGIEQLQGLEKNLNLRTLDVGNNRISVIENLSHLTNLEELWLNDNLISSLNDVPSQLSRLDSLRTIYLEGNPCQKNDMTHYRRKLILALPQVTQVDATFVKQ